MIPAVLVNASTKLVLSSPGAASAGEDHARQSRAARAAAEPGPPLGGAGAVAQAAGGEDGPCGDG